MRNLKRALSLVMAAVMLIGMMVVSAGAVSYDEFTDKDEIVHTEAVSVLNTLNVIVGKDDGSFDPNGIVTRGEMAKIICVMLNGGEEPVMAIKPVPTYSDIDGHWAESYIEYCTSMNIIAGDGAGRFNPEGTLTASQTAKMFLTAMGYNANVFGFTGTNWEVNTNRYANEAGLYKELGDVSPSDPISRDDAAQMAYNAIQATMMKRSWSQDLETGKLTETYTPWTVENASGESVGWTLLNEKFNGAVEIGFMTGYSYDAVKDMWTYDFDSSDFYGAKITANNKIGSESLRTAEDYTSLYGRQVKVIYNVEDPDVVYGVYAYNSSVIAEGYSGDITSDNQPKDSDTQIKIGDTNYKLDARADATRVISYQDGTGHGTLNSADENLIANQNYSYQMIDNDGDNKIDVVIVLPFTVAKVTYVGNDSVTFAMQNGDVDADVSGNRKLDDIAVYDDIAKDDYVMCVNADHATQEVPTYTKLETVSGTISGVKGDQYKIDDVWYTNKTNTTLNTNDTIDYIALGSVIHYAKVTSGATGTEAVALVYNIADKDSVGISSASVEAGILLADGTKTVGKVAEVNGVEIKAGDTVSTTVSGKDASGNAPTAGNSADVTFALSALKGQLVKYEVNSDGELSLWTIPANYNDPDTKLMGFDGTLAKAGEFINADGEVAGEELADDAVVFVQKGNDAKVYTGKELKNTLGNFGTANKAKTTFASGLYTKTSGFTYATVVVLQADSDWPSITTGANYGYLVEDAYTSKENGTNYRYYTYWDGTQNVEAKEKDKSTLTGFTAGTVITFDVESDGVIKNVSPADVKMGAVTGWEADTGKIEIRGDASNNNKVTDDTVVLYVDSEKQEGVAGGEISEAVDQDGNGTVEDNVLYIAGGDRTYSLIVVDVNQEMHSDATVSMAFTDVADLEAALAGNNVELTDATVTLDAGLSIPDGRKLTVKTLAGTSQTIDVADNASLVANAITNTGAITVGENSTLNVTGNVAGNITSSEGTVKIGGNAASIAASSGTVEVTGTMSAALTLSGDAEATVGGAITGAVTLSDTASATVASATGYTNTSSGTLTITNDTDGMDLSGVKNVVIKCDPTAALTLNGTSEITIASNVAAVDTIVASGAQKDGAKITFASGITVAGTPVSAGTAGAYVIDDTVVTNAADLAGHTFVYQLSSGDGYTANSNNAAWYAAE